jgi:hypothetical protein
MSLLDEAEEIANHKDSTDKKARCIEMWAAVVHANKADLAKATARAWYAEAALATTPFARSCCRQAARMWEARA